MTTKDYVLLANTLNLVAARQLETNGALAVMDVALALATELERSNARFDRNKFIRAVTDGIPNLALYREMTTRAPNR